jgi:hypothetical protein
VNDNPLDEMNADQSSTVEETDDKTQGEETSTEPGGGFGNDRTALVTLHDEINELRAKMIKLETSHSDLLTRLLELDTKPLPVKTTESSDSAVANNDALTETTTHEPGSIEPCANAAITIVTDYEVSKMTRTGTDPQEGIRELFKRQNMKQTKAPTMVPQTKENKVQWIQLMRRPNITNETTTMMKINYNLYDEDSVTVEPIRLVPIDRHLDQPQKYEQTSVRTKPHTDRAFNQDISHHLTDTQGYDNLPPDISMPKRDEHVTHPSFAGEKNNKPEVDTIKRVVKERGMTEDHAEDGGDDDRQPVRPLREIMVIYDTEWDDNHNADSRPRTMSGQEELNHAAPRQGRGNRHQENRLPYTYEKPDIEDILDHDQHKDHYMVRNDAINEVAKYETHQQDVTEIYSKMADNTA